MVKWLDDFFSELGGLKVIAIVSIILIAGLLLVGCWKYIILKFNWYHKIIHSFIHPQYTEYSKVNKIIIFIRRWLHVLNIVLGFIIPWVFGIILYLKDKKILLVISPSRTKAFAS